jgi:beta-mannanase
LVEFGTEVNWNCFPWNGQYNGGSESTIYGDPNQADGPERFRDAYRHIIDIFNKNSVDNITWFFHVDADGSPATSWNEISQYYPGDGYIDWIGLSVYGAQESDEEFQSFVDMMDDAYAVITTITDKPIAILEFAVTE